jgi:hypothetical protein
VRCTAHRRHFFLRYFSTIIGLQGIGLEVQLLVSNADAGVAKNHRRNSQEVNKREVNEPLIN